MFNALDISTSALVAQRTRLNVISSNVANQHSIYDAKGNYNPFRRRIPIFATGDPQNGNEMGVHVKEIELDEAPFMKKYKPGHPAADADGYVEYPNINSVVETVNAMEASRAYQANITAAETTKTMMSSAMTLLA